MPASATAVSGGSPPASSIRWRRCSCRRLGYGLRYEYGMFRQAIENGWQREYPDNWLHHQDPWEVARPSEVVEVKLGCSFEMHRGKMELVAGRPSTLIGVPYDRPVVGFGGKTINMLRLWKAAAHDYFDFKEFSGGDFVGALVGRIAASTLTRVLYPDDSTEMGQELRFTQEYFLVACSLADLVRRFRRDNTDWNAFPDKVAIQLNDTHPTLAVPELMRILLDEAGFGWDAAWDITQRTLAYTNHTLLPEALERWPLHYFQQIVPRQLEIIFEINRRFLDDVRRRYPNDEARVARMSLIEEGPEDKVRMANLAIVGSHSTNGVAAIHSQLLRATTVKDFAEMFPERFNNKTNGVTPRRWLLMANPALSNVISDAIGDGWTTDFSEIAGLKWLAGDAAFRAEFLRAKREAKSQFSDWLQATCGQAVDPDSIFDCQVKRIHEYKRQMLNALRIVVLYNRMKTHPELDVMPRIFFFAGKAAPAYRLAKLIIKFLNNLADTIAADPVVRDRLKVVFLPEYCVSLAERLIPAADISNQISTAGYEASGTSNMKFMMNGALTIGTRDGATIEMAEEAGEDNFFLFGLSAQEVAESRGWYSPYWHYEHEPETRAALDMISGDASAGASRGFLPRCGTRCSRTATITCTSPICDPIWRPTRRRAPSIAIATSGRARPSSTWPARASSPVTGPSRNMRRRSGTQNPARWDRRRRNGAFTTGRQAGPEGDTGRSPPAGTGLFRAPAGSGRSRPAGQLRDQRAPRNIPARLVQRAAHPGDHPGDLRLPA